MKIERSVDCGNSPKNKLVEDLFIGVVENKAKKIRPYLDDKSIGFFSNGDTSLDLINEKNFFDFTATKNSLLKIMCVTSHGKVGAANGLLKLSKNEQISVSVFFAFTSVSAKVLATVYLYRSI